MPYTDQQGRTRFSRKEQYWHNKGIADAGKVPERKLADGTVLPAKKLTNTEIHRYASKAEVARKKLNDYKKTEKAS